MEARRGYVNRKLCCMEILDRLLEYDRWIMCRVLDHCARLSDEQLDEWFDIGWETIQATLVHVVRNMELWNDLLHGRVPRTIERTGEPEPTMMQIADRYDAVSAELAAFARSHACAGTLNDLMLDTLYDPPRAITFGTVLCDIFHENMVHRSEIKHMLKRLGAPPIEGYDPMAWEWANKATNCDP